MGILDSFFGSGQQQQGPPPDSWHSRFQAEYAPGAYAAHQQSQQQQAMYNAAMQTQGMNPQVAQALAMSPQYFAAQQGAFLPQPSQTQVLTDNSGNQTMGEIRNPGGGAGHSRDFSGLPITPPGTTPNPATPSTGTPEVAGNTLGGMPGNTNATIEALGKARDAGQDPYALIPQSQRAVVKNVIDGKMTLSEIKQNRNEHEAGTIRKYVLAIDPEYNELKGEKSAAYVKSYMDTKTGDVGMSRNALGTSLGHISDAIDNQIGLKNHDANMAVLGEADNKIRGAFGEQANKVGQQNLQLGTAADELAKFITGKPPSDTNRGQYREMFPSPFDTPRVAAGKYTAMADLLEKRMTDMEAERDANFSGKNVAKDYPISLPQHHELIDNIRKKAAELRRQGEYQIERGQGQEAPPVAGGGWSNFRVGK